MAGFYADVPGPRMAYDRDGTVVTLYITTTGAVSQFTTQQKQTINNESTDGVPTSGAPHHVVFYFPELRDITHMFHGSHPDDGNVVTEYSTNSTNPLDGTWTSLGFTQNASNSVVPAYRTSWVAASATGVKAIRFKFLNPDGSNGTGHQMYSMHIYGSIHTGENPDRLRLWHPTLDQELTGAYFDWGDVPRSTSSTKTFRVKNNSSGLTANTITLSTEALTDTTPSVVGQHTFSTVSSPTYASTKTITTLAPGAISEVITLRRVTPADAILSLWTARVVASAASWTA